VNRHPTLRADFWRDCRRLRLWKTHSLCWHNSFLCSRTPRRRNSHRGDFEKKVSGDSEKSFNCKVFYGRTIRSVVQNIRDTVKKRIDLRHSRSPRGGLRPNKRDTTPCVKSLRSGDTTPCRMTGVTLHGVVSPEKEVLGTPTDQVIAAWERHRSSLERVRAGLVTCLRRLGFVTCPRSLCS